MQLTIDVDKHFMENLKEEFHTTNIKDALSQLFDFYKQSHQQENNIDKKINQRVEDYKNGTLETKDFYDGLDSIRKNILSKV
jgi:SLT domain-containing protein